MDPLQTTNAPGLLFHLPLLPPSRQWGCATEALLHRQGGGGGHQPKGSSHPDCGPADRIGRSGGFGRLVDDVDVSGQAKGTSTAPRTSHI